MTTSSDQLMKERKETLIHWFQNSEQENISLQAKIVEYENKIQFLNDSHKSKIKELNMEKDIIKNETDIEKNKILNELKEIFISDPNFVKKIDSRIEKVFEELKYNLELKSKLSGIPFPNEIYSINLNGNKENLNALISEQSIKHPIQNILTPDNNYASVIESDFESESLIAPTLSTNLTDSISGV